MNQISKRAYRDQDFDLIFQFMVETYSVSWKNGVPAPFFEYAQKLPWTDREKNHLNGIWEEEGKVVGFCFFESNIGTAFLNVREGYHHIIPDMLDHAEKNLYGEDGNLQFVLFAQQEHIISAIKEKGYEKISEAKQCIYSYEDGPLKHQLPDGFYFEEPENIDYERELEAIWRGFDNEEKRPLGVINPTKNGSVKGNDVVVKNEDGEYVSCAGLYMVPENKLAYMEPLATLANYRNKGIASAVLSEVYRRTSLMGATHMTGGYNSFYYDLGFKPLVVWTTWSK